MRKAVFFDRDGVINKERGDYTYKVEDFHINNGIIESMNLLQNNGFDLFIITNQGGIAKNIYNHSDVEKVHSYLLKELVKNSIQIQDIYYCPHHDQVENCLCRKPGHLLLEKAIATYNIDVSKSYMFGDRKRDVLAAENAGIKGILISSNRHGEMHVKIVDNTVYYEQSSMD